MTSDSVVPLRTPASIGDPDSPESPDPDPKLRRVALVGAATAAGLGALAILGWLTPARILSSFGPAFIPMAPSTALGFLVLGGATACHAAARSRAFATGSAAAAALAVSGVAAVQLAQYLSGSPSTADVLLVPHPARFGTVFAGRMSPLTAIAFLLGGAALLGTLGGRRRPVLGDLGGWLASLLALLSVVVILGYSYGTPLLYGGTVVPMALTTALGFAALSAGLIAGAGRGRFPLRPLSGPSARARLLRAFLPIAPAVVVADGLFFRFVPVANPALHAVLLALLLALLVAVGVGRAAHIVGRALDRVEEERRARTRAEHEMREKARVLTESQRVARLGSYRTDLVQGTWTSSAMLDELFGIGDPGFRRDVAGWLSIVHPDEREEMAAYFAEEVVGKQRAFDREYRIRRLSDGEERWVHGLGELIADEEGRLLEMIGTIQDITERKAAEAEKAHVEGMLRQSQRLEAIGRLAGGVAHDFNNLLGVITGYGELMRRQIPEDHPARPRLEEVLKAAERAAGLTRQLLAFSRQQLMQPRVLDLNARLRNLGTMLERIVGEDVEIEVRADPNLGAVKADPTQIDQVVMNLVVNARDAMPTGGHLTIEMANADFDEAYAGSHPPAQAGHFVMIAVSDDGLGMDAETQKHVFEPFFTTKEPGEGSGLGLATVYGIVKQSGGYVWVYSEPGRGTTFKIYLPRVEEQAEAEDAAPVTAATAGGQETVLLVEDNEALREAVREALQERGYAVLVAGDGEAAVETAAAHAGPIHLLLSDVVMPRLGGPELAARVVGLRPGIRVLYMSGYSNGAVSHHGVLGPDVSLLEKPFTGERLARAVRAALDHRTDARG
jgi:signal transduction histidine kinase/CheY-like chemotaxis protein